MISQSIVFGENNPTSLPHIGEPFFIPCIGQKMVVVDFDFNTFLTKCPCNDVLPQRPIHEKYIGIQAALIASSQRTASSISARSRP